MNEILQYIAENQEAIGGLVGIAITVGVVGRKRATKLVMEYLKNSKEDFLRNIDNYAPIFAKYIYAKLPKSARLFLTVKRIEKIILKFAKEIQDLDKK